MAATLQYQTGHGMTTMPGAIARSIIGTMTYLAPTGPLTSEEACDALEQAISECIVANQIHLILDLEQISLMSGRALEIILDKNTKLASSGGSLQYVNPSALIKDILIVTGLGDQSALKHAGFGELLSVGEEFIAMPPLRLGEILLEMGKVTEEQLENAANLQSNSHKHGLGQRSAHRAQPPVKDPAYHAARRSL
jgi:type IV pilus assembly protein PilB